MIGLKYDHVHYIEVTDCVTEGGTDDAGSGASPGSDKHKHEPVGSPTYVEYSEVAYGAGFYITSALCTKYVDDTDLDAPDNGTSDDIPVKTRVSTCTLALHIGTTTLICES